MKEIDDILDTIHMLKSRKKISVSELARALNVSRPTIYKLLEGKGRVEDLRSLLEYLQKKED